MATMPNTNINIPYSAFLDPTTGRPSQAWLLWLMSPTFINVNIGSALPVTSGGTGLTTIPTNGQLLIGNGTGYTLNTLGFGAGISVTNGSGTITVANTGVLSFSGGTTGLTPTLATTGVITLAGTLIAANGGTGFASYAVGDLLYANTATTLAKLSDIATGNALISGGVATAPAWGKIGLTTHVSGILPIANGGTNGTSTPTAGAVPYGTGTAYAFTAAGTTGQVLTSAGASVPIWTTPTTGTVTSVGLAMPTQFAVTNSPVTSSGTLTAAWNTQSANVLLAGPASGAGAVPTFRALTTADLPALPYGTGTVTSVALTLPSIITVSGSPITTSGTLAGTLTTQSVNSIFAGPSSGAAAAPTFRALTTTDIPALSYVSSVSGTTGRITSTGGLTPVIDLASGVIAAGTTGSITAIPVITVDTYGRVTSITTAANPQGTVTSVTGTSPVVSSGGATPAISLATAYGDTLNPYASKTANTILAAPSGSAGVPTFRALTTTDIPSLSYVTSVALALPSIMTVSGSPVTSSGTLTGTLTTQAINRIFAGPSSGSSAAPTFRALVTADIPSLSYVSSVGATAPITSTGGLTPTIGVTAAALAKTDDTNVTMTLSGAPTTALLAATTMALGWTGQLAVSRGGTGAALTTANFVFAGPTSGAPAAPTFRALTTADISSLGYVTSVSGTTGRITSTGGTTPVIDLASGVITAGTTGSITAIPVITVDTYGRVTSITTAANPQGTVTSVGLSLPSIMAVTNSPVTSSGTLTGTLTTQAVNSIFAGPSSGAAATPTFRALTTADIPALSYGTVTSVAALTLGTTGTDLSSTVANSTTTPVITLNVPTASASNRGALSSTDWTTFNNKGSVTSVSFTGGLITVATATTTPALTVAGTSGGIVYFSSASTWASSAALTQYGVVYGGGAGAAPVATAAGTTGQVLTATTGGAPTWANPATSGTVTSVSVVSANGFAGTVATSTTTPAITISTSITGVLKGNGTAISAAVANTDYVPLSTVITKTADYTITGTDTWIINNKPSTALTLTFPAASSWTGRYITVKNMQALAVNSASSNIVPIDSTTAGTAILLGVVGNWATLVSDGTNWVIMQAASNNNLLLE